MSPKVRLVLWLLTAWFWAYDFYLWGGLYETPKVGRALMREAPYQYPLAATYMFVGANALRPLGLSAAAQASAARRLPSVVAHPEQLEYLAVQRVQAAQSLPGRTFYTLAPVLLVLSLLAHWRRQKQIRIFGTRR